MSRRSREGKGEGMAEPRPGGREQELESVDEFLRLLKILKIRLPKGVVTAEALAQSTPPNVITDAELLKRDLENGTLGIAAVPRLACGKLHQALKLKEAGQFVDITKIIFFPNFEDGRKETLRERWMKNKQEDCGFQVKATYGESASCTLDRAGAVSRGLLWKRRNTWERNARECLAFYLKQKGLTPEDVRYKSNARPEFEFLSARLRFLVEIKSSPGDSTPSEKLLVKCNSSVNDAAGRVFSQPKEGHVQAEFYSSHPYYLQALGSLFILRQKEKMEESPLPVNAVMVLKSGGRFVWGEVREDTQEIEYLNNFCKSEALPRFLAVLRLIFEKTSTR